MLSTSTLASEAIVSGGFGPVNPQCYALGYGIRSYGAQCRAMTYKGLDSKELVENIGKAMEEMREIAQVSA